MSGDCERPSSTPGGMEWDTLDEEARMEIVMAVNNEQNVYLFEETTAKGMWDKLKEAYQETSVANTLRLKSKFNSYRMDPQHTITEHVKKVKEMAQELKAVGVIVPKEDIVLVLLDSLPEDYRMVKSSLKSQKDLSVELVCSRLKEEEHDLGLDTAKEHGMALYSHGRRSLAGVQCYNCGKFGHVQRYCRVGKEARRLSLGTATESAGMAGNAENRECFECHQIGHLKKNCPVKSTVKAMVVSRVVDEKASTDSGGEAPWIIDSGATHHMCHEKSAF